MILSISKMSHYFGGLRAVSDFNMEIKERELMALIGPNGAGKTTIFNLITGVYKPNEGIIHFKNQNITGLSPERIVEKGIARTFQNIRLFREMSVLDNIRTAMYCRSSSNILTSILRLPNMHREEKQLTEKAMNLLHIFEMAHLAKLPAKNLPYGRQRRLEIARALACEPGLLLLDEPAAGMNPNEIGELMDTIVWLRKTFPISILLIEHQIKVVTHIADRVTVIDFGSIIAKGTPSEIKKDKAVIRAYLGDDDA